MTEIILDISQLDKGKEILSTVGFEYNQDLMKESISGVNAIYHFYNGKTYGKTMMIFRNKKGYCFYE